MAFGNRYIWQISRYYSERPSWSVLLNCAGRFPLLTAAKFVFVTSWEPKGSYEFSPKTSTNQEVRGQVKNLEGPQLFLLLRLWVAKVLQSTISAPVSPLLSQRKGIQQGLEGPSQSPVAREMGVSLTTMDKCLMTSRQCSLAPHCYHDRKKCFHKHMLETRRRKLVFLYWLKIIWSS